LTDVRRFIDSSGLRISFPVEVRFTAGDDIPLSTAYGEERCYIAVHVYWGMPYEQYFRGVEAIMDAHGGRPHWGKMHYQTAMTSPGSRVIERVTNSTSSGTEKMRSSLRPSWRRSPFTHVRTPTASGFSYSSTVTTAGPIGLNES